MKDAVVDDVMHKLVVHKFVQYVFKRDFGNVIEMTDVYLREKMIDYNYLLQLSL